MFFVLKDDDKQFQRFLLLEKLNMKLIFVCISMSYLQKDISEEDAERKGDFGLKFLFLGLAQTGKSSIIKVVFENMEPEKTKSLPATVGLKREYLDFSGYSLNVYDVGGQITYLEEAFIDLRESIFSHLKTMFFVVDSSNLLDLATAKKYFERAYKNVQEYSKDAKIFVLAHKMDLIPKEARVKATGLISEFFDIRNYENVELFETSIYEQSIFEALKKALD